MALAQLSAGFQSLPPLPTIKLGPFGAASQVGGFVYVLGLFGSFQWTLLWGWEFLPLLPQPPQVFSIRGLRLYFPCAGTLGWAVCHQVHQLLPHHPAAALPALLHNPPPRWVHQLPFCRESSPPGCPSLPVSAPPTGLDECFFISLVVRLPYSSIFPQFWLFLNCCCPSFGCVRRHSVSTYASILAVSPGVFLNIQKCWVLSSTSAFNVTQIWLKWFVHVSLLSVILRVVLV